MSKTGKLKKNVKTQAQKQKKAAVEKKGTKKAVWIIAAVLVVLVVTALLVWDKYHRIQALKVADETVYKDEILYYIYESESENNYVDQIYEQLMGSGFWESASNADETRTNAEVELERIRSQAVMDSILAQEAQKAQITLTQQEQQTAEEKAEEFLSALSEQQKSRYAIRDKNVRVLTERIALAEKYKEQIIEGYGYTKEDIQEEVDYEQYRQYDVQYYSISYMTTDEDGNTVEVDAAELAKRKEELSQIKQRADQGEAFETLLSEDAAAAEESEELDQVEFSGEEAEGVTRAECDYSDSVAEAIFSLENNEISEVLQDEEAGMLYVFKMLDNDSKERYEQELENSLSEQQEESFAKEYEEEIFPLYHVTYRENVWEEFTMGDTFSFAEEEDSEEDRTEE